MNQFTLALICISINLFIGSEIQAQCNASFSYEVDCNCVTFTPNTVDSSCVYTWDFGLGGLTSNQISPTFCYPFTGNGVSNINVNLNIECSGGTIICDSSQNVLVNQIPDAEILPLNAEGWINCTANINDPAFTLVIQNASTTSATDSLYIINWGDSTLVNGDVVPNIDTIEAPFTTEINTYIQLLSYDITFTVIGQNACAATNSYTFINSSATPDIGLELDGTSNECVGYEGTFIIRNTENNPPFTRYIVRIDDGVSDSIIFQHPPPDTFYHIFNTGSCFDTTTIGAVTYPHSFSISVTAQVDSCGAATAAVGPIRIDTPPEAAFSIGPDSTQCILQDTFHLTNESIPGDYNLIATNECSDSTWYYWTVFPNTGYSLINGALGIYNDIPVLASPGTPDGISLVFDQAGEYTLSLVAQSILGSVCDTSRIEKRICVLPDPLASFTSSEIIGCAPFLVDFTNTSNTLNSCEAAVYNWSVDFLESECGQDSSYQFIGSDNISPSISFNSPGQYLVQLQLINRCDTSYSEQIITVANPSIVEIVPIDDACVSTSISASFENLSECYAPPTCTWYFPGSSNPAIDTFIGCTPPSISYNDLGSYVVTVVLTNDCGVSIDTDTFNIFPLPEIPDISINGPVCEGENFCILVSNIGPNDIIEWTGPQGWSSTTPSTCIFDITSSYDSIYLFTVTDTITGCQRDTLLDFNVLLRPDLMLTPSNADICIGDTTIITASGADEYSWSPAAGLDTTSGNTVLAFPEISTSYIITGTDTTTGCINLETIDITVNPLPTVEAGPDTFVCTGNNLILEGTPIGGVWSGPQMNVTSDGVFNESTPGTYTLYYDYIDSNACANIDSLQVCVINTPTASFSLDNTDACIGETIQATNTSNTVGNCIPATYLWSVHFNGADCHMDSTGWSFASGGPNAFNASFTFNQSGIYSIQLQVANSCDTVVFSQVVTIGEAPSVTIDSLPLLCDSFTITPSASFSACNNLIDTMNISWQFPGANITTFNGPTPPAISYTTTGNYAISVTLSNSCGTSSDDYNFDIFSIPNVSASNNSPICVGETLSLNGIASGIDSILWTGPDNFNSNELNPTIEDVLSIQGGTYTLTVIDGNGCSNMDTTFVNFIAPPPMAVFPSMDAICIGDTTIITASGADVYYWSPATGLNTTSGNTVLAFPDVSTSYIITGTDTTTGCISLDTIDITVNSLPVVEAGLDTFVCAGNNLTLEGTPLGGVWSGPQMNVTSDGVFNESTPGTYTLYYDYIDGNACASIDSLQVCVINNPVANFTLDSNAGCEGLTVQATNLSNTLENCIAATFTWSVTLDSADCHMDDTGWSFVSGNANTADVSIIFSLSGQYTISLMMENSCGISTFEEQVIVGSAPSLTLSGLPDLCEVFTIQPSIAEVTACNSEITSYAWTFEDDATPSSWDGPTPPAVTFAETGPKSVSITVSNDCGTTSIDSSFEIYSLPSIEAINNTPICEGDELQLLVNSDTGTEFTWTGPEDFLSDIQNPVVSQVTILNSGIYQASVLDQSTGCSNQDTTLVVINPVPVVSIGEDISLCPDDNPIILTGLPANGIWSGQGINTSTGAFDPKGVPSGNYTIVYTYTDDITLCSASDTLIIMVNPPPIEQELNDSLCIDDFLVINGITYNYDNPSGIEILVSSVTGCDSLILDINLGFWDVNAEVSTIDPSCFAGEDGMIIIEEVISGTPPYTYSINGNPPATIGEFPVEISSLPSGTYDIIIEDAQSCMVEEVGILLEDPAELILELGEDQFIKLGEEISLNAIISPLATNPFVNWEPLAYIDGCDTCAIVNIQPWETTTYSATYTDGIGCVANDQVTIFVNTSVDVFAPDAFSPNGDGRNDFFTLFAGNNVSEIIIFEIYDRWGNMVFQAGPLQPNNELLGWDGTFKGEPMNPAVFAFYAEIKYIDGREGIIKGDLTLVR